MYFRTCRQKSLLESRCLSSLPLFAQYQSAERTPGMLSKRPSLPIGVITVKPKSGSELHISNELQVAAESVLYQGEDLSSFVESSIRRHVDRRMRHRDFIARGLASGANARKTGKYVDAKDVFAQLEAILTESSRKNRG